MRLVLVAKLLSFLNHRISHYLKCVGSGFSIQVELDTPQYCILSDGRSRGLACVNLNEGGPSTPAVWREAMASDGNSITAGMGL